MLCTHLVSGNICRSLCNGRSQLQTHMWWWEPGTVERAGASCRCTGSYGSPGCWHALLNYNMGVQQWRPVLKFRLGTSKYSAEEVGCSWVLGFRSETVARVRSRPTSSCEALGVRAVVFRHTAGGVRPLCTYVGGRQLWGSRLVLAACWSWSLAGSEMGRRRWDRLRRLESVNMNTCGTKTSEICSGSVQAELALFFFPVVKATVILCDREA